MNPENKANLISRQGEEQNNVSFLILLFILVFRATTTIMMETIIQDGCLREREK